jgi:hypothetical protein
MWTLISTQVNCIGYKTDSYLLHLPQGRFTIAYCSADNDSNSLMQFIQFNINH